MSILVWVGYCVLVSAILLAGAAAWEAAARWSGRASRAGWLVALAGSVTLPWLLRLLPDNTLVDALPIAMPMFVLDPISATSSVSSTWTMQDAGTAAWIAMSALMLTYVCAMLYALARARRAWRSAEIDGNAVLVSKGTGPAALGLGRGAVVMPAWVLDLDTDMRSMLLRHERSHVDAGDPRLLFAGLLLLAAMPWNPIVWLQFLRLRNAIELDCDARVLGAGANPVRYGSLLLEVGRRRSANSFVMATFAEPRVFLRERIRRIARWPLERRRGRAAVFTILALFMFGAALSCDMDDSGAVTTPDAATPADIVQESNAAPGSLTEGPVFTPYTQKPELVNGRQMAETLVRNYPPLLRDAGIGGRTLVWILIDTLGNTQKVQLKTSSGYSALDAAALRVAATMKWSPARNRAKNVPVWLALPIVFDAGPETGNATSGDSVVEVRERVSEVPRRPRGPNEKPELVNASEITRKLVETYPPLLRDAGIGGRIMVTFSIDKSGTVQSVALKEGSGHPALDAAALALAPGMRFMPARLNGRDVATVTDIPIVFTAK